MLAEKTLKTISFLEEQIRHKKELNSYLESKLVNCQTQENIESLENSINMNKKAIDAYQQTLTFVKITNISDILAKQSTHGNQ